MPALASLVALRRLWSVLVAVGLLLPAAAPASGGIAVLENRAEHAFAQRVTFTLQAAADTDITAVYLFFGPEVGDTTAVPLPVTPARTVTVEHVHDLRDAPLPPFAIVNYWWRIEDAAGETYTTPPEQFRYTDNRFRWEELSGGGFTVHWIAGHGDPVFGQTALDIARQSAEEINAELRAPLPPAVDIYIYDGQYNLDAAMVLTGQEWVGGQAHPELGVVLVAIPAEGNYAAKMERDIPHEITHLLVYQAVTPAGYRYVPEWLDEGLATANEQLPAPDYDVALENARAAGRLIPLQDLCVPFPPDPGRAMLSYAESRSVVRFIRERYGGPGIRALLRAYADGASCASGVRQALHVSLGGLETAWRASLEPQSPWRAAVEQVGVWVGLWVLSVLVALPLATVGRRHGHGTG